MNKTLGIIVTTIALSASASAMAASAPKATMADCEALIKQFDNTVSKHADAPKLKQAQDMRAAAEKSCKAGDYKKGVADLHTALADIGEKPAKM